MFSFFLVNKKEKEKLCNLCIPVFSVKPSNNSGGYTVEDGPRGSRAPFILGKEGKKPAGQVKHPPPPPSSF